MDAFKSFFTDKSEYELILLDAQEDVIKQQDLVNTVISQGIKLLIVIPVTTESVDPIIASALDAKIPLVFVNRNPFVGKPQPENTYYVGSDTIISGMLQSEYLGKLLNGSGGLCILQGTLSHEASINRTEGNEQVIRENYPGIKVLAKEPANWQRDQGMTITENWLTAYGKDLSAILANNDEMALGAVEALRAAGRPDVVVMGIDGIPDAVAAVKNGTMAATVLLSPETEGRGTAEVAYKIINGQTVEPFTKVSEVFITQENAAQF
jgi:inositol transport system substrate-binding protein